MKKILILLSVLLLLTGCGKKDIQKLDYVSYEDGSRVNKTIEYYETNKVTNYVLIDTSAGKLIATLYPDIAPLTVANFQKLVKNKFYTNLIFHRVIKDFMIQTGDPTGTGSGGTDEKVKGEFLMNGFNNKLSHTRGVLSMARADDYNSASSQFFIVERDNKDLDSNYAAFGEVIAGIEVVDIIANVATNENDRPIVTQKLNSIRFIELAD